MANKVVVVAAAATAAVAVVQVYKTIRQSEHWEK